MPHADLGDISLHYKTFGSGFPVLGIMGFALDQRYWAAQVGMVAERNTFVTFDNRGVGRSSPHQPSSLDEMADDAVRLLDHLEIDKAIVFGTSMGGAIAQRLVLDHPERVEALILAITFARPLEYMRRQQLVARQLIQNVDPMTFQEAALLWMFTPRFFEMGKDAIDQMLGAFTSPGAPEMLSSDGLVAQIDALGKHDVLHELHKIQVPTLVVGGKADMMVPYLAQEEIAEAIPGAELATFETGHGLMFEEMDAFNSTVRAFLDRVTP